MATSTILENVRLKDKNEYDNDSFEGLGDGS